MKKISSNITEEIYQKLVEYKEQYNIVSVSALVSQILSNFFNPETTKILENNHQNLEDITKQLYVTQSSLVHYQEKVEEQNRYIEILLRRLEQEVQPEKTKKRWFPLWR